MEGYEKSKQPERNPTEDREAFLRGVEDSHIQELPTTYVETAAASLAENIARTRIFLLGETHGVKENASIIYTLFKKFGLRNLALEWSDHMRGTAERFLQTGDLDFDAIKDSADGRITPEHFALLRTLRDEELLREIICFDHGPTRNRLNDRDANMARNLRTSQPDGLTLIVAGNWHTQIEPVSQREGEYHPMGELLVKEIPTLATGKISYLSGQFYNFGVKDFGAAETSLTSSARFSEGEDGLYTYELPVAHAATVPNPHERL